MKLLYCEIENYGNLTGGKKIRFNVDLQEFCEKNGYGSIVCGIAKRNDARSFFVFVYRGKSPASVFGERTGNADGGD